jgi:hypothetical protein
VAAGGASLAVGRVRVTATPTTDEAEADVAVLRAADGEVHCRVRAGSAPDALAPARTALFRSLLEREPDRVARALDTHFGGRAYGVDDVFLEERRRLVARAAERGDRPGQGPSSPPDERSRRRLLAELDRVEGPVPPALASAARAALGQAVVDELAALAAGGPVGPRVDRIRALVAAARSRELALALRLELVAPPIAAALARILGGLRAEVTARGVEDALAVLALGGVLEASPTLWAAQNEAARLWRAGSSRDREVLAPLMSALGFAPGALAVPHGRG